MLVSTCRVDQHPDLRRGYVLHLTNLEEKPCEYLVVFTMTAPDGPPPSAGAFDQLVLFHGENIQASRFRRQGTVYIAEVRIRIDAGHTTPMGLQTPPAEFTSREGLYHVEGYVTLRLPPARDSKLRFRRTPQSDRPVRVLVNPETRTLYRTGGGFVDVWDDDPRTPATTALPARTIERTEPLHVATGQAENELEPEGGVLFALEDLARVVEAAKLDLTQHAYIGSSAVPDQDRIGALIELLGEVADDKELVRAINNVLEEQKAPMRLCPKGRK